ncbi:chaperonin 10-like protein [Xylogone sp. PMI_703]|nr:chaperonin 10-like protein [Xylogone sp. PMI_703]
MSIATQALVSAAVNTLPRLEEITLDSLRSDEVLVEIYATGICHTDLSCMNGTLPADFPSVFGHEGAGIVLDVGRNVENIKTQDKVLLSFDSCRSCLQCTSLHPAYCQEFSQRNFGQRRKDGSLTLSRKQGSELRGSFFGQSSFAKRAIVSSASVVKVPANTPLDLFCPLGCGIQTGAGVILNTLDVQPGKTVVVFGVGAVGMSAVMAAKIRKARVIIAIDLQPQRLELAMKLGATHVIRGSDEDIVSQIQKICGSNGADYSVDCAGVPQVVERAIECLGTLGKAATVGAPSPGKRVGVDIHNHLIRGRQYIGCCEGDAVPQQIIPYLIDQHSKGHFPLHEIVTYYPISQYETAFTDVKQGKAVKAVLLWG